MAAHAERLRARRRFAEVHAAFWKEEPSICRAVDLFEADSLIAVPVFMSAGYFTEQVIARELGIAGRGESEVDGKCIRYTEPVGAHPALADVIIQRAREADAVGSEALVVLGHGTARHPGSETNIYRQSDRVRRRGLFAEVHTVFLDQEPALQGVWSLVATAEMVVVPLFVADGWHVGETIPEDLDLVGGTNRKGGRHLRFARAVGTHPLVSDLIETIALARP